MSLLPKAISENSEASSAPKNTLPVSVGIFDIDFCKLLRNLLSLGKKP